MIPNRFIHLVAVILSCIFFVSCSGVTDTGNPYETPRPPAAAPGSDDGDSESEPSSVSNYYNTAYNVTVGYPKGWIVKAAPGYESWNLSTLSEVVFSDSRDPATTVHLTMSKLASAPSALLDYLKTTYADKTFEPYNTGSLSGFIYDSQLGGPNGGDIREYFFLKGAVLLKFETLSFAAAETELEILLTYVSIQ